MDDNGSGFVAGLFVAVFILIGVLGFTEVSDGVIAEDYERAAAYCAPNEGVNKVFRPEYAHSEYSFVCNNGATFKLMSATNSEWKEARE